MLAAVLAAAALAAQASAPQPTSGDWVLIRVHRVIAPENMPDQCFVQAQVDQVVHGGNYSEGQVVAISVACRRKASLPIGFALSAGAAPITLETLKSMKRALVHLDAGARVVDNQYYNVGALPLARS